MGWSFGIAMLLPGDSAGSGFPEMRLIAWAVLLRQVEREFLYFNDDGHAGKDNSGGYKVATV